jgi:hypothetical protein
MKVYFEATKLPVMRDLEIVWHAEHGWTWNIVDVEQRKYVGVFFATLTGDGCIVHFSTIEEVPWYITFAAMKKAIRLILPHVNVIYATIPAEKEKLVSVACRLGFRVIEGGEFLRDGKEVFLLKYFERKNAKLFYNSTTKGGLNVK